MSATDATHTRHGFFLSTASSFMPTCSLQEPWGYTHTHTHDKLRSSHDVYFVASVFEYKLAFVCRQCKAPCDEAGFIMKKVR